MGQFNFSNLQHVDFMGYGKSTIMTYNTEQELCYILSEKMKYLRLCGSLQCVTINLILYVPIPPEMELVPLPLDANGRLDAHCPIDKATIHRACNAVARKHKAIMVDMSKFKAPIWGSTSRAATLDSNTYIHEPRRYWYKFQRVGWKRTDHYDGYDAWLADDPVRDALTVECRVKLETES